MYVPKKKKNQILLIIFDTYMHSFILILISWNLLYSYSKFVVLIILIPNNTYDVVDLYTNYKLMVISFLQRRCHPVTRCIKKIAYQPCYNVIFYLRTTEQKYLKKCMPVFTTYWEVLPDRYFFDFKFWALVFITKKNFFFKLF